MNISTWVFAAVAAGAVGFWALGAAPHPEALQATQAGQHVQQKFHGYPVSDTPPARKDKVTHTDAEWHKILTDDQFKILRASGTESAFCGGYLNNHQDGVYECAACGLPLFKSDAKFESGTGWPSFFQPVSKDNIWLKEDDSLGMQRVEVLCPRCESHLGHVFDDGPEDKTGLRFCINSACLKFVKKPGA